MKDSQLEKMSVKQLQALLLDVQAAIESRKESEKIGVKAKVEALIEKSGFSIGDLYGQNRRANGKGQLAPKYRNPSNPDETWTGRGRMPLWMKALTDKGAKREKFLIK